MLRLRFCHINICTRYILNFFVGIHCSTIALFQLRSTVIYLYYLDRSISISLQNNSACTKGAWHAHCIQESLTCSLQFHEFPNFVSEYRKKQGGPDTSTVEVEKTCPAKVCNVFGKNRETQFQIPILAISILKMKQRAAM